MRIVKKILKILLISILILITLTSVAIWYLFTPENLTPIVNKQAKKYLTCETTIKKVEPTLFSSYPFFGVEIVDLCLKDNNKESKGDTIVYAKKCLASFNVSAFLFDNNIELKPFLLEKGYVNFKVDKTGKNNLDIVKQDATAKEEIKPKEEPSASSFGAINLDNIKLKNFKANYLDESTLMYANINDFDANISVEYSNNKVDLDTKFTIKQLNFKSKDSLALVFDSRNTNLEIKTKGDINKDLEADINFNLPDFSFAMQGNKLASNLSFASKLPIKFNINKKKTSLNDVMIKINNYLLKLSGNVELLKDNTIKSNIDYSTNEWDIEKLLSLVPKAYAEPLKPVIVKGLTTISGNIKGLYSENSMPVVITNFNYKKGFLKYEQYPSVKNVKTKLTAKVDLNKNMKSSVSISQVYANVMNNTIDLSGNVNDLMGIPDVNLNLKGNFNTLDFKEYIPKDLGIKLSGIIKTDINTKFNQADIEKQQFHKIYLDGTVNTNDLVFNMKDSIKLNMPKGKIKINLPTNKIVDKNAKLVSLQIESPSIDFKMLPSIEAFTENLNVEIDVNHMVKELSIPKVACKFKYSKLNATMDTMSFASINTGGNLSYAPTKKGKIEIADITAELEGNNILVKNKDVTMFNTKSIAAKSSLLYDQSIENPINWKPVVFLDMKDANFDLGDKLKGKIPNTSFSLTPEEMIIKKASVTLGNSDFNLSGKLSNITNFFEKKELLEGKFDFKSDKTDLTELMDIFNGMGVPDSTIYDPSSLPKEVKEAPKGYREMSEAEKKKFIEESNPFMVPMGVNFTLNTEIKKTIVNDNEIENIKGGLTINNGKLVLNQVGFTSKAANMKLSAVYKSKRKNHLFASLNFNLLNIDIEELIKLIPMVDTIVPMLKSFKGRGDFYLSGSTKLFANYDIKKSTLIGATAFDGKDLTLMDNETFKLISKYLRFEKKTENKIKRLGVEMTVLRDEVELFPFLIELDDYKAVISGRHYIDDGYPCAYHVSVTDSPLPVRLGLDIKGPIEKLSYSLAKCKYKHLYNPKKQGVEEKQTLRFKKIILEELKKAAHKKRD